MEKKTKPKRISKAFTNDLLARKSRSSINV